MRFCATTCHASCWCHVQGKTVQGNERSLWCFYHKHRSMKQRNHNSSCDITALHVNKKHLSRALQHLHVRGQMAPGLVTSDIKWLSSIKKTSDEAKHIKISMESVCVSQSWECRWGRGLLPDNVSIYTSRGCRKQKLMDISSNFKQSLFWGKWVLWDQQIPWSTQKVNHVTATAAQWKL